MISPRPRYPVFEAPLRVVRVFYSLNHDLKLISDAWVNVGKGVNPHADHQ